MCALVPPFFPNFGWPLTGEYESYYLAGENLDNCTFFYFPVPETYRVVHQRNSLGVSISSAGTGIDNSPVVNKKLKHNASERDRRKKINSLFSSLCSCLPASDQSKKLSIPQTVSRSLKHILELQEEVKKLIQKKEELLVRVSGQRAIEQQPKIHNFWISNVLSGLEEDGIVLVDVSLSRSQGERVFYTLHLQVDNIDNDKLNCTELSQMMLYLYEECGNSY
ncbi:hypothetical protein F2Q69_00014933 [Brassica cretica]|uniref:BHLH domain-containing protein n=1 Tax=Brassica cretica TaxID=69181 RepID=A0A8S9R3V6_BRACR|nr:hypothetical protein F2Q69_00014933 [Brassica cretica]